MNDGGSSFISLSSIESIGIDLDQLYNAMIVSDTICLPSFLSIQIYQHPQVANRKCAIDWMKKVIIYFNKLYFLLGGFVSLFSISSGPV
jgi:hypothetical protein